MKRVGYLYENIYNLDNIMKEFNEICKNTKIKRKVNKFKELKCINITKVYTMLKNRNYEVGPYIVFQITDPKPRTIVSQRMTDKLVNHLVSRHILQVALENSFIETNVASRENKGTKAGLEYYMKYRRNCKIKYGNYYILKCDIKKYFASIDHDILKEKLKKRIKDKDALDIVFKIIDSSEHGLGIGNMTSQVLAVFYLSDLDHYIKEVLKIKYYVRYQDDFVLFHESKEYLKECLEKIKVFLEKEKLTLNDKTRIYNSNGNIIFLGRDKYGRYAKYRRVKRKIKKSLHLYNTNKIMLSGIMNTIRNYENLLGRKIKVKNTYKDGKKEVCKILR